MTRQRGGTSARAAAIIVTGALASVALVTVANLSDPRRVRDDVHPLLQALTRWDTGWYVAIAERGYWYAPGEQNPVAFFPAYPLVIRALGSAGLGSRAAAVLVSLILGPVALYLFYRWAARLMPERTALGATALFVVYPFSFYLFGVAYSEALFLTAAIGSFLFLERGQRAGAVVLGALATACRPIAPALVLGLLVRQWELRHRRGESLRATDAVLVLAGAGMAAYVAFLWWKFGEPLAFAKVQGVPGWDHPPTWETWLKLPWFEAMFPRVHPVIGVRMTVHAALALGALALCWPCAKRLGWGYAAYSFVAVAIPTISMKDFHGMGRYAMAAFPLVLTLWLLVEQRTWLRRGCRALSAALLVFFAVYYGRGGWAA